MRAATTSEFEMLRKTILLYFKLFQSLSGLIVGYWCLKLSVLRPPLFSERDEDGLQLGVCPNVTVAVPLLDVLLYDWSQTALQHLDHRPRPQGVPCPGLHLPSTTAAPVGLEYTWFQREEKIF